MPLDSTAWSMEGPWVPAPGAESGAGRATWATCSVDLGPRGLSWSALNSAQVSQGPTANRQDTKQGQLSFMEGPFIKQGEHRGVIGWYPGPQTQAPLPALGGEGWGEGWWPRDKEPLGSSWQWETLPGEMRRCPGDAQESAGELPVPDPLFPLYSCLLDFTQSCQPTGNPGQGNPLMRRPGAPGGGQPRTWIREAGRDPPHCGPWGTHLSHFL